MEKKAVFPTVIRGLGMARGAAEFSQKYQDYQDPGTQGIHRVQQEVIGG